jgi:Zn-dependent M28 family amino/carboxypeptidase
MQGRLAGSPGGEKARTYVIRRLEEAGVAPIGGTFQHHFTFGSEAGQGRGTNVVGIVRGTRSPNRFIVVTAHYDHIGVRGGEVFNGADDNASGVAALLAVGEHFSRSAPESSLLLVATDAEEAGLLGARAFVRNPPVPVGSMIVNVNIDMVGRDPARKLFASGLHHWPFLKPYLENVAHPPVVLSFGHDVAGAGEDWTKSSDHYAFHEAGIPWIYFGVEHADEHHEATDDLATIDRELLAGAAATVIAAVRQLDAHLGEIAGRRKK